MNLTKKLYDEDPYARRFTSAVLSVTETRDGFAVILEQTLFFPEEGGQCCDGGTLNGVPVTHVSIENGIITHFCKTLPAAVGEAVTGEIDFAVRFRNMQHHTAEHIVSGLVSRMYSYRNVGFHLGSHDVTMDYDGAFTDEILCDVEKRANEAVYQNVAVTAQYYNREQAAAVSYRSKKEIDGDVRIVTIPEYDVCACCAPHVARTGEIGLIKLICAERYKGGTRIHMLAGADAMRDYAEKHAVLSRIAVDLSVKPCEAEAAVLRLRDENDARAARLSGLQKALCRAYAESVPNGTDWYFRIFSPDEMSGGGLKTLAELTLSRCRAGALFLKSENGFQFLLYSSETDINRLFRDFCAVLPAKGGGKPPFVTGFVSADEKAISDFFDRIKTQGL